jgi:hypothetical protein
VWVNYAFARLDTAALVAREVLGPVRAARVVSTHDLPHVPDGDAVFELTTHPWSWAVTLLGPPTVEGAKLRCGGVPVELEVHREPGLSGIRHEVHLLDARGTLTLTGRFRVGHDWVFTARRDGPSARPDASPLAEPETGPPDPWYAANARSIAAMARGEQDGLLFDWERALQIDRCAQQLTGRR